MAGIFDNSANAENYTEQFDNVKNIIVPSIVIFEVYKLTKRERGNESAGLAVSLMEMGNIANLTADIIKRAADFSNRYKLSMADSIVYATAQKYDAELWSQDIDHKNLPDVKYFPK